eukprot:jgi/Chlat1/5008/Chrsp32S04937
MESVPQTPGGASDWADDETDAGGLDRAALTVAWEQVGAFVAEEFSQAIVRVFKRLGVHLPAPVLPVPLPKASDETEDEEKKVKRGRGRQPTRQKRPKKLDADGNVIVRPPSLYNKFVAKHVQQVREAAPSLPMPDVMKAISKLWKGHKLDGDDLLMPASEVLAAVEELVESRARDIAEGRVQLPKPKAPKGTRKRKGGQDGEASVPATPGPPEADEEIEEEDTEPESPAPVKNKANAAAAAAAVVAAKGQTSKQGARRKPIPNKVQQQESSDESEEEEETPRPPLRPQPASVPELDSDGAEQGVEVAVAAAVAAAERERLRRKNRNKKKKQKQRQGKQVVGRSTPGDGDEDEDEDAEESPILKPRKQNKKQRHVLHSD